MMMTNDGHGVTGRHGGAEVRRMMDRSDTKRSGFQVGFQSGFQVGFQAGFQTGFQAGFHDHDTISSGVPNKPTDRHEEEPSSSLSSSPPSFSSSLRVVSDHGFPSYSPRSSKHSRAMTVRAASPETAGEDKKTQQQVRMEEPMVVSCTGPTSVVAPSGDDDSHRPPPPSSPPPYHRKPEPPQPTEAGSRRTTGTTKHIPFPRPTVAPLHHPIPQQPWITSSSPPFPPSNNMVWLPVQQQQQYQLPPLGAVHHQHPQHYPLLHPSQASLQRVLAVGVPHQDGAVVETPSSSLSASETPRMNGGGSIPPPQQPLRHYQPPVVPRTTTAVATATNERQPDKTEHGREGDSPPGQTNRSPELKGAELKGAVSSSKPPPGHPAGALPYVVVVQRHYHCDPSSAALLASLSSSTPATASTTALPYIWPSPTPSITTTSPSNPCDPISDSLPLPPSYIYNQYHYHPPPDKIHKKSHKAGEHHLKNKQSTPRNVSVQPDGLPPNNNVATSSPRPGNQPDEEDGVPRSDASALEGFRGEGHGVYKEDCHPYPQTPQKPSVEFFKSSAVAPQSFILRSTNKESSFAPTIPVLLDSKSNTKQEEQHDPRPQEYTTTRPTPAIALQLVAPTACTRIRATTTTTTTSSPSLASTNSSGPSSGPASSTPMAPRPSTRTTNSSVPEIITILSDDEEEAQQQQDEEAMETPATTIPSLTKKKRQFGKTAAVTEDCQRLNKRHKSSKRNDSNTENMINQLQQERKDTQEGEEQVTSSTHLGRSTTNPPRPRSANSSEKSNHSSSSAVKVQKLVGTTYPLIQDFTEQDILIGVRRGRSYDHPGNRKFHDSARQFLDFYMESHSNVEKMTVAKFLVDAVHKRGGRFLRRQDCERDMAHGVSYVELNPEEALQRARDLLNRLRRDTR